jgi:uncharacterized flavoprotein (TIGR03862 family)
MTGVAVIGGGPAGLMAAEVIAAAGVPVDLYDAMPSVGRKFLLAGKGGMNLTHSEPWGEFVARYGARSADLKPMLELFGPEQLRAWARGLGIETFVGSSGRVFPSDMKAAPLLRAWLHRLRETGVRFHMRHRWLGWSDDGALRFTTSQGEVNVRAAATVLALGGGSWARLGSDGAWVAPLAARGVAVAPLLPANCGFDVAWSEPFRSRFAGEPVKPVVASFTDAAGLRHSRQGEFVITAQGIEGGLVYALAAPLRDTIAARGSVALELDLAPGKTLSRLAADLARPRGRDSLSNHLRKRVGIAGVKAGLVHEAGGAQTAGDPERLAALIKAVPVRLLAPRPIDEAISTAGGVVLEALDHNLMVRTMPGLFCAGEMLDWEAPTGGYLLTACFATGRAAGRGVINYL